MTVDWAPPTLAQTSIRAAERLALDWRLTVTPAGRVATPAVLSAEMNWTAATVPGTASLALSQAGFSAETYDLHEHDVWFRAILVAHEDDQLRFLGLAGLAEIWIDETLAARSVSMFVSRTIKLPRRGECTISICFRSLAPALREPGGRARWRTKLVTSNALRLHRQTLLGHMPGWCPASPAIGPFRPVERIAPGAIRSCRRSAQLHGRHGHLRVELTFAGSLVPSCLMVEVEGQSAPLHPESNDRHSRVWCADLVLPDVELWWPHTHGTPRLYDVVLTNGDQMVPLGHVGFREVAIERGADERGFAISVNGVPVFCRGACWTSADLLGLRAERTDYLPWLTLAREAGMNMIRVGGTMLYESPEFHALCDELGIMLWQDLMFANMDYPMEREALRSAVLEEVTELVERLDASPSLVVLCGGSEMAQQAAMLGLDEERRSMPFFERDLPAFLASLKPDLHYVPHSPWGGELPFTVGAGVAHYFGVGAYRRPLEDARRANVRFATECLAFANPPVSTSPAMKAARTVPRDLGVSWDFADTRDHYLHALYGVDPASLRSEDPGRYFELSRAVTADLMEAVFAEWRRPGSTCGGGLVWQLQDVAPGSGWGLIDSHRLPKPAWHGMRRVCAPVQLLISDEGLDGLTLHVINEQAQPLEAMLELSCLRRGATTVAGGERPVTVAARGGLSMSSRNLLERFFDINRAFTFGAAEHDITIATLRCAMSGRVLSEAFHFPAGRALPPDDLGLSAAIQQDALGWNLVVSASRFAQALHVDIDDYCPSEDWFHLAPGRSRRVRLTATSEAAEPPSGFVHALNSWQPLFVRASS